ncbi:uncharacterized protein LOC106753343 [Vigna radiata var. radiata]|uniref:Uncharacterized protein LOC106753343 n=1 Tax=Vigna radiata var. radiata TaxID=3916 RepID=A0A1S3TA43_VIGRR|nr:uncharacterized protein LOC106753343 [Vigna radiata var. radiata]
MIDAGSASLAVVYSNDNCDINVGTVVVDPSLNFKSLLSLLSQMTGISPHQFSVYLAAIETDRKIPTSSPRGYGALLFCQALQAREEGVCERKEAAAGESHAASSCLRRRSAFQYDVRADYEQRLMNFQMERDSFRMNMSAAINCVAVGRESPITSAAICEDCLKANTDGIDAAFHRACSIR